MLIEGTSLKRCPTCKVDKERSLFGVCRAEKSGLFWQCKECTNAANRRRYAENPAPQKAWREAYKKTHPDRILETRRASQKRNAAKKAEYSRLRYQRIKAKQAEWHKRRMAKPEVREAMKAYRKRYESQPHVKIAKVLKWRTKKFLKENRGRKNMLLLLGLNSREELVAYLESKFKPGMTWQNHSKYGWHIDHILPLSKFNLLDPEQLAKAFHHTNLQPLWWHENISKGNRILETN